MVRPPAFSKLQINDYPLAKKAQLDLTIDAILKPKKAMKSKRKKKDAEEEVS